MTFMTSPIAGNSTVCSTVWSGVHQRTFNEITDPRYWPFVREIHRWPGSGFISKRPVTRKAFPCDDIIMDIQIQYVYATGNDRVDTQWMHTYGPFSVFGLRFDTSYIVEWESMSGSKFDITHSQFHTTATLQDSNLVADLFLCARIQLP